MNLMIAEISKNTKNGMQGEIFCYEALFPMENLLVIFKATADPDIMCMYQVIIEPERTDSQIAVWSHIFDFLPVTLSRP